MNWQHFEELEIETPEEIVSEKINGFENATGGLTSLVIQKIEGARYLGNLVEGDFKFELVLTSPIYPDYQFSIMNFGYGIKLLPIYCKIEESIYTDIFNKKKVYSNTYDISVDSVENFQSLLDKIFESNSFVTIVRGLMKVAKKHKNQK
jgi:hypothetical protein